MKMLRILGGLLLLAGGWLTGDAFQAKTRQHLDTLHQTILLLGRIRQEIAYRRADLQQLCRQLYREGLLPEESAADTLQSLAPPPTLTAEERRCFAECMAALGRSGAEQECQQLDYYLARFGTYLQQAQQKAVAQAGLPHKLGLAAGAVLALVFL